MNLGWEDFQQGCFMQCTRSSLMLNSIFMVLLATSSVMLVFLTTDLYIIALFEGIYLVSEACFGFYGAYYYHRMSISIFGALCCLNSIIILAYLLINKAQWSPEAPPMPTTTTLPPRTTSDMKMMNYEFDNFGSQPEKPEIVMSAFILLAFIAVQNFITGIIAGIMACFFDNSHALEQSLLRVGLYRKTLSSTKGSDQVLTQVGSQVGSQVGPSGSAYNQLPSQTVQHKSGHGSHSSSGRHSKPASSSQAEFPLQHTSASAAVSSSKRHLSKV